MKRSAMPSRTKPLPRPTSALVRSPLSPRNEKRAKKRWQECYDSPEFVAWCHRQQCCVAWCRWVPSDCAHVRSRGAGGTAADVVPLCRTHHDDLHTLGVRTFEDTTKLKLKALAAENWAAWGRWQARAGEQP